jgi:hypothetical protein
MATPARLVMCCTLVSQIEFPLLFGQVMHHGFWGTAVVAARNIVLLTATVLALRALWKATTGVVAADGPGTADGPDAASHEAPAGESDAAGPSGAADGSAAHHIADSTADTPDLEPAGAAGAPAAGQSRGGGRD